MGKESVPSENEMRRLLRILDDGLATLKPEELRPASACPDSETFALFIEGETDEKTRKEINAHIAMCDTCYEEYVALVGPKKVLERINAELTQARDAEKVQEPEKKCEVPVSRAQGAPGSGGATAAREILLEDHTEFDLELALEKGRVIQVRDSEGKSNWLRLTLAPSVNELTVEVETLAVQADELEVRFIETQNGTAPPPQQWGKTIAALRVKAASKTVCLLPRIRFLTVLFLALTGDDSWEICAWAAYDYDKHLSVATRPDTRMGIATEAAYTALRQKDRRVLSQGDSPWELGNTVEVGNSEMQLALVPFESRSLIVTVEPLTIRDEIEITCLSGDWDLGAQEIMGSIIISQSSKKRRMFLLPRRAVFFLWFSIRIKGDEWEPEGRITYDYNRYLKIREQRLGITDNAPESFDK